MTNVWAQVAHWRSMPPRGTATRGERGWRGDRAEHPGLEALGKIREQELRESAKLLSVRCVEILDYIDGDLDQADPHQIIGEIAGYLRQYRPQVVITFDPWGAYGHPDHIAICQFTMAAVICAADPEFHPNGKMWDAPLQSHRVDKLYYMAFSQELGELYQSVFGELVMHVNGEARWAIASPNWGISAVLDTAPYWQPVWQAVRCHRSQHDGIELLRSLPDETHQRLWGKQEYYRALSVVNGGPKREDDLFAGLR